MLRANLEVGGIARKAGTAALGHAPIRAVWRIQGDVQTDEILGVRMFAQRARPRVVGGEHRTDESDERDAGGAFGIQRVDVPPRIPVRRDDLSEVRSCITCAAAMRPDSAAIGTPGPGWTLPPAR